jgi:hypothetical protein
MTVCALCGEKTPMHWLLPAPSRLRVYFHRECHPSFLETLRTRSPHQVRRTLAAIQQRAERKRRDPGLAPMSGARREQIERASRAHPPPPPAEAAFWADATLLHTQAPDDATLRAWLKTYGFAVEYLHALATVARVGPVGQGTLVFPPRQAWITTPLSLQSPRPKPSRPGAGLGVTEARPERPAKGKRPGLGVTEARPEARSGERPGLGAADGPCRSRRVTLGEAQFVLRCIKGHPYAYRRNYVGTSGHARPRFRDVYLGRVKADAGAPEAVLRTEIARLQRRVRARKRQESG